MSEKLTIGVLFGGRSAEHQVSLVSATSVLKNLDQEKYNIVPIGITADGTWYTGQNIMEEFKNGQFHSAEPVFLPADPSNNALYSFKDNSVVTKLDAIFPVLHGTFGEDGTIQGLLELAGIPYVGPGVLGASAAMDKIVQKEICLQNGVPCVDYVWFRYTDWAGNESPINGSDTFLVNLSQREIIDNISEKLDYPVFVKPPNAGSSVGVSKASNERELVDAIDLAFAYDTKVLIEKAVKNPREIEVAVLGNESPQASVCGEVESSNDFYDYDAKYVDGASELSIPANLDEQLAKKIRHTAIKSYVVTNVEGMARVDFLVEKETGNFYLNELNTIPGFTSISMYPKLWEATGLAYSNLLDKLIELAIARHNKRSALNTTYQPKNDWYK